MTYSITGLVPRPFAELFAPAAIRCLLNDDAIAYIDTHNAAPGRFAARIERSPS